VSGVGRKQWGKMNDVQADSIGGVRLRVYRGFCPWVVSWDYDLGFFDDGGVTLFDLMAGISVVLFVLCVWQAFKMAEEEERK